MVAPPPSSRWPSRYAQTEQSPSKIHFPAILNLSHQEAGEGKQGDPHVMAHPATSVDRLSCDITRLLVLSRTHT